MCYTNLLLLCAVLKHARQTFFYYLFRQHCYEVSKGKRFLMQSTSELNWATMNKVML